MRRWLLALGFLLVSTVAHAQGAAVNLQCLVSGQWRVCDVNNPLPVSVTVSASVTGFTALTTGTPISVTTGGVTGTLPAGAVVVATNVGTTNAAYCALGASATPASQYISPGGGWFAFTVGASTQLTCITSTSTTAVNMTGGSGLATGTGGGSGSGGSSSNASVSATGSAVPASATYIGIVSGGNLTGWNGKVDPNTIATWGLMSGTAPGTAPTNTLITGGIYNSSGPSPTTGQTLPFQIDAAGNLKIVINGQGVINGNGPAAASASAPVVQPILNHASTTALGTSLVVKNAAANLNGFNCTGIAGGAAGYCVAYNATAAPSTGALTGSLVLDACYYDTTARGCSLAHVNGSVAYSAGIVILLTSAATPLTYTTGTNTGYISGDYD